MAEQIEKTEYSELMQKSYIDYSMSVITSRAVPDVRDGLKPVQRRVLYAMDQLGLDSDKPHRKSARIVGDAMGKYHPHGDSSIYETLVVLAQDFKKGMALVDGHGNFGSIEGDGAAAMRYTEARLKKFTEECYLADLDKNVVDFVPNFDETEKEPAVLPVRVPNLLVNGADGIAVGMVTNIPPHNLGEVMNGYCAYLDADIAGKEITNEELMQYVIGPDFPTGGIVINKDELPAIYEKGVGKIKLRGRLEFEQAKTKSDRDKLVVTEIPYTMIGAGISKFISDVVSLVESKEATDIVDITNESSKEGIRICMILKKNADVDYLKNLLYKKTRLEDTFGVNMLAIANGKPETLSLKDIYKYHCDFRFDMAKRKYTSLLDKELANREIKEGLIRACDCIDLIIEILRGSKNLAQAKACLIDGTTEGIKFKSEQSKKDASELHFTANQATAILEMRLYKLIGLEIEQLNKEYQECLAKIAKYEKILGNHKEMAKVIRADLEKIKIEYQRPRRTTIENGKAAVIREKEFEEQEVMFLMDRFGYAKTIDMAAYERNMDAIHETNRYVLSVMNTDKICIFTDNGNLHQVKVKDIPFTKFKDKGTPIDNLGNYDSSGESIIMLTPLSKLKDQKLLFVTEKGMMKLVDASEFQVSKRTVAATKLSEGDLICGIYETDARILSLSKFNLDGTISEEDVVDSEQCVITQTEGGYFLKFPLQEIPLKKKNALGVCGMKVADEDKISDVYLYTEGDDIQISIDSGKRVVDLKSLRVAHRATKGSKVKGSAVKV